MRSALGKAVRKQFETGFKRLAPEFKPVPAPIPGGRLFERRLPSGLSLFVSLEMHHMYDMFHLWLGWSTQGGYPVDAQMSVPSPEANDIRFPAPLLWDGSRDGEDWVLAQPPSLDKPESFLQEPPLETALEKVEPTVQDALRRIQEHVLPFLERVAAAHGG